MQRRARADDVHHADQRAPAGGALDVDHLVVAAHREVDRLAGGVVQLAHEGQGVLAHADARLDQVAEFEQPHPEAVAARVDALDHAVAHQRRQDAVRGRRMEPRARRQHLEADRIARIGQDVEQLHHALDDLDGVLRFLFAAGAVLHVVRPWRSLVFSRRNSTPPSGTGPGASRSANIPRAPSLQERYPCASASSSPVSSISCGRRSASPRSSCWSRRAAKSWCRRRRPAAASRAGTPATAPRRARWPRRCWPSSSPATYVVAPSGSCSGMIRTHYPALFADAPVLLERIERLGARDLRAHRLPGQRRALEAVPGDVRRHDHLPRLVRRPARDGREGAAARSCSRGCRA